MSTVPSMSSVSPDIAPSVVSFGESRHNRLLCGGEVTLKMDLVTVTLPDCPFLCMQEKEILYVAENKTEIYFPKIDFVDCK